MDSLLKEKRILTLGGIIGVSLITIVGLIIWSCSGSCSFSENEPVFDLERMARVESDDHTALMDFEGYLSTERNVTGEASYKQIFLPLSAKSVKLVQIYKERGRSDVILATNCAKITFKLQLTNDEKNYYAGLFEVEFTDESGVRQACAALSHVYWTRDDSHYSCRELKSYSCLDQGLEIARLNIGLEFEINRDPKKVTSGEYLTRPTGCIGGYKQLSST